MKSNVGRTVDLGELPVGRGFARATLCPLGEAWVLWVRRDGSETRQHLGVLSMSPRGYVFTSRRGRRTESDDWRELIESVVARHR